MSKALLSLLKTSMLIACLQKLVQGFKIQSLQFPNKIGKNLKMMVQKKRLKNSETRLILT